MPKIEALRSIDLETIQRLIRGYTSYEKYKVSVAESEERVSFVLQLVNLESPYHKISELDPLEEYQTIVSEGFSLAAYEEGQIVGIALATPQDWNGSLWIHEFHVLEAYQGKSIGRALMEAMAEKAKVANLRIMYCETQNTNVPAIRFYRKLGFHMEALNLSLYTNEDYPDGEIALFMKRRL
jgi:ribosomal protein S18 acetylase RimI-like enzyme